MNEHPECEKRNDCKRVDATFWAGRLRHFSRWRYSFRRSANKRWRNKRSALLFLQSRLCFCSAGVDLSGGKNLTSAKKLSEGARGPLCHCVFVRRDSLTRRNKTNVGETLKRRRCYFGVAMVNFQPESTGQDEKIRTGRINLRQAQSWRSRLGYSPRQN